MDTIFYNITKILITILTISAHILVAQELYVGQANSKTITRIDGSNGNVLSQWNINTTPNVGGAVGLEYDNDNQYLYIGGGNFNTVVRSDYDGTDQIILTSASNPYFGGNAPDGERLDFAIDKNNSKIFFTTGGAGRDVCVGNLDGSGGTTILFENLGGALNGIEYDYTTDKLYFINLDAGVYSANADGSGTPTLLFSGTGYRQLALDFDADLVYWTDWTNQKILKGSMSGGAVTEVFSGLTNRPYGISLDAANSTLYWTEVSSGEVYKGQTNGTGKTLLGTFIDCRGITGTFDNPLPVELSSFTANVNENNVILNWQTATEVNNYGFEIQKQEVRSKKPEEVEW